MKFLMLFLLVSLSYAAIDINPGLWEVEMKISSGGKEIDPMAEVKKAMAKMSPEQKKQMEAMMKKMGKKVELGDSGGFKVCYTKEMLAKDENIAKQKNKKCKTSDLVRAENKIKMNFECEDGTKGTGIWTIIDKESYKGDMDMTSAQGKSGKVIFNGKFSKKDCGTVKPIL